MDKTVRLGRDEMFMGVATLMSMRGTCQRLNVGAVITQHNRMVSSGYNGPSPFAPDCNEQNCKLDCGCTRAIHAEANAIAFAAREGIALEGGTLYCTASPCLKCSELIIQSGIKRVVFAQPYRIVDGVEMLKKSNIEICQVSLKSLQITRS